MLSLIKVSLVVHQTPALAFVISIFDKKNTFSATILRTVLFVTKGMLVHCQPNYVFQSPSITSVCRIPKFFIM